MSFVPNFSNYKTIWKAITRQNAKRDYANCYVTCTITEQRLSIHVSRLNVHRILNTNAHNSITVTVRKISLTLMFALDSAI